MPKQADSPDSLPLVALKRAVALAGSQSALAKACEVKQGHVWWWLNKTKHAPANKVLAIEKAVAGQVSRYELRPDIYPPEELFREAVRGRHPS